MKTVKTLRALKPTGLPDEVPVLQAETPARKIQRLTAEHAQAVEDLQTLKRDFAQRNLKAQQLRQAVSTPEITAFEAKRKELAQRILDLNTAIGSTNREVRELRAARMGNPQARFDEPVARPVRRNGFKQETPMKRHKEFPTYFLLAAEAELDTRMFERIVSAAKGMLAQALQTGIEQ